MSREVECGKVPYKSSLILSVMVYVKQMHEDCFSLVSKRFGITRKFGTDEMKQKRGRRQLPCCPVFGLFMAVYWLRHGGD